MKGINQKQGQAVEPDMVEKKKPFIRTVLKGAGLLFLFLFITGMIGNFSTPARFTSSSSVLIRWNWKKVSILEMWWAACLPEMDNSVFLTGLPIPENGRTQR